MLGSFSELEFAIRLFNTSKSISKIELGESTTCDQKPNAVCSCPIGEAVLDSVALEFMSVRSAEDLIASDLRGDDLTDDVLVGEANNEAILGSVVFIFCLGDETLAGVVISLSCSTTLVLGLVTAVLLSVASCCMEFQYRLLTCSRRYS